MAIAEAILSVGLESFGTLLTNLATEHAKRVSEKDPERVKTDLRPHIEATYRKCSTIKTLLNPYSPANFLSIYATQRFRLDKRVVDQYDLVTFIRSPQNNVILTGTGGSGKSMFFRYLWLSLFERSEGRVPLFIELRNLNSFSQSDVTTYLFHSLTQGSARMSKRDFERRLARGDFIILFDGFDELAHERREPTQKGIMALAENYPDLRIIVSSRPDDRFASWTSFHVVSVAPLEKRDVLELIEKAEFDPSFKERFHKRVKADLFDKHSSFLSNPLLASMMLLTFSHNLDIPDKMHLFYDQAFEALYQRHDSHKPGGFKREFKTALSEDTLKRLLSYFCLVSYYDQRFTFERQDALDYVSKAAMLEQCNVNPTEYLHDMDESVCLLVREGLTYTFSHRSFQEYFAAYCLSRVTTKKFEEFIKRFARRANDQVVPLIADMNPELFRDRYVLPIAEKYGEVLQPVARQRAVARFYEAMQTKFVVHFVSPAGAPGERRAWVSLSEESELSDFANVITKLLPDDGTLSDPIRRNRKQLKRS